MADVTRLLSALEGGDARAAEQLLPLVYEELRKLAAQKLAHEKPGQTLQATALVHEAYMRLVANPGREPGGDSPAPSPPGSRPGFANRAHFFAVAAEAMRRILVEQARRKRRDKHGGNLRRIDLDEAVLVSNEPSDELLAVDEALARLEEADPDAAALVKLRYYAGLTMPEAATALGIPLRTAERNWTYARTWLHRELSQPIPNDSRP
jgi:RNA polymerase sigma factor (sigma-70 family)